MGSDSILAILKPTVKRDQTASVFVTTLRDLEIGLFCCVPTILKIEISLYNFLIYRLYMQLYVGSVVASIEHVVLKTFLLYMNLLAHLFLL